MSSPQKIKRSQPGGGIQSRFPKSQEQNNHHQHPSTSEPNSSSTNNNNITLNVSELASSSAAGKSSASQYDAKRLRKSFLRRTVDYNSALIVLNEFRQTIYPPSRKAPWPAIQPDIEFMANLMPPSAYWDKPITSCTTKFVHTSMNKYRSYVNVVRWTPEGRRLITGSASGELTLWNGLTFNFETILQAHETSVRSMKWSRNDTWMLSGDNAGWVKYWQSNMNNLKSVQVHKEAVRGISFSPTDAKFATCSDDKKVKVWNFNLGVCENSLLGHGWDVKCLDWHPYQSIIASGSKDNLAKLWDPRAAREIATLHGHKNTIHALSWNRNGNWLLSGSRDQTVKVFDLRILKEIATFKGHPKEVCSVAWHPQHEGLFASGGSDGSVLWWMIDNPKNVAQVLNAHTANIWALDWHPLGHILCTASNDYATRFWTRPRPGEPELLRELGLLPRSNLTNLSAAIRGTHPNNAMEFGQDVENEYYKDQICSDEEENEDAGFYLPGFGTIGLLSDAANEDVPEDDEKNKT